ncbi:MAG: hypothetical protein WCP96_20215 [Methylococcaceae bacterium]
MSVSSYLFATTYVDASGNTKTASPNALNEIVKESSDSGGDVDVTMFNEKFKSLIGRLAKEK